MKKIEVLRSDVSIRNNISTAVNKQKHNVDTDFIRTETISAILEASGISNVAIEEKIETKASDTLPDIGQRSLPASPNTVICEVPDDSDVFTFTYANSIKNNLPLENNYVDMVRGNVIHVTGKDSTYQREFDTKDHAQINAHGYPVLTNSRAAYKKFFLHSDGMNNKISNCFQGQDLSDGATLSFWVRYHDRDAVIRNCGLITFLGDYEKHYFNAKGRREDNEYVDYTTHLSLTTGLNLHYDEAFHNTYEGTSRIYPSPDTRIDRCLYRSGKAWMHVSLSFTNDDIRCYINGMPVSYDVKKGKRFGIQDNCSELWERTKILDFLSDENTTLYLSLSLDETKISEMMLFDDITFWDSAIKNDTQAMELFEEAARINLP